jgi:hypothetical protein
MANEAAGSGSKPGMKNHVETAKARLHELTTAHQKYQE